RLAGFEPADPAMIVGSIGRLAPQKGYDILLEAAPELIRRGVRIVVLGSGEPALEGSMRLLEAHYPRRFKGFVGYDDALSHKIQAGSDVLAVPSRYEPCGLTQMYALAYGTVPVVRRTGGLADTVDDYHPRAGKGTGFLFDEYTAGALVACVKRALKVYHDPNRWKSILKAGMQVDFSWRNSAKEYVKVYHKALHK
ncbi:MAG: glycosyltransferase, partial [Nitrospirae bacterium]|nr:glycosyltransferase [Nitrospirota bacterium]